MRTLNIIPAAMGFLLAFAAGASAVPISPNPSMGAHGDDWMSIPRPQFWGHRHGHHAHGLNLQALFHQPGSHQQGPGGVPGTAEGPWGFGNGNEEELLSSWLCGGASDEGGTQDLAEAPPLQNDDETDPGDGDGDGSPTMIASDSDANPSQPMPPAVPEPGSLALLGAGVLGLLAAHALLKKP